MEEQEEQQKRNEEARLLSIQKNIQVKKEHLREWLESNGHNVGYLILDDTSKTYKLGVASEDTNELVQKCSGKYEEKDNKVSGKDKPDCVRLLTVSNGITEANPRELTKQEMMDEAWYEHLETVWGGKDGAFEDLIPGERQESEEYAIQLTSEQVRHQLTSNNFDIKSLLLTDQTDTTYTLYDGTFTFTSLPNASHEKPQTCDGTYDPGPRYYHVGNDPASPEMPRINQDLQCRDI